MMKVRSGLAVAAGALTVLLATSVVARAEERVCRGSIGAVTVDNLRVPQSITCYLDRTRVKGTIKVERGAKLDANRVVVIGNVQAEGANSVTLRNGSRIGGSVQLVQGGSATIINSSVDGSIQLESNRAALRVLNNEVNSDVQAFQNRGGVKISDNRVDGNLQCKSNTPAPTGGSNIVQGNKEDQCRRL